MEKDKEKDKYNKHEQIVLEKIDKNNEILEKYFIKDRRNKMQIPKN